MKVANKADVESGLSNLIWVQGDAMLVESLIPEEVDCILIANTIHGVQSKSILLHSIANKLKPKGIFAVINWHKLDREQTQVFWHCSRFKD